MTSQHSPIEVDAICKHSNQSYPVPLTRAGNTTLDLICNFCNCPHCDQRNDLWINIKQPILPKHKPEPDFKVYTREEKAGYSVGRARGWNECVDAFTPTSAQHKPEKENS